jgi:hypothetical protein
MLFSLVPELQIKAIQYGVAIEKVIRYSDFEGLTTAKLIISSKCFSLLTSILEIINCFDNIDFIQ